MRREGEEQAGLCASCEHGHTQHSARGSTFWRCLRADVDPAYRRYPPLPVLRCGGFEPSPGPDPDPPAR